MALVIYSATGFEHGENGSNPEHIFGNNYDKSSGGYGSKVSPGDLMDGDFCIRMIGGGLGDDIKWVGDYAPLAAGADWHFHNVAIIYDGMEILPDAGVNIKIASFAHHPTPGHGYYGLGLRVREASLSSVVSVGIMRLNDGGGMDTFEFGTTNYSPGDRLNLVLKVEKTDGSSTDQVLKLYVNGNDTAEAELTDAWNATRPLSEVILPQNQLDTGSKGSDPLPILFYDNYITGGGSLASDFPQNDGAPTSTEHVWMCINYPEAGVGSRDEWSDHTPNAADEYQYWVHTDESTGTIVAAKKQWFPGDHLAYIDVVGNPEPIPVGGDFGADGQVHMEYQPPTGSTPWTNAAFNALDFGYKSENTVTMTLNQLIGIGYDLVGAAAPPAMRRAWAQVVS